MLPKFVEKVGLAGTGGKQAILKCADDRFFERIEFVWHNGCTPFPKLSCEFFESSMIARKAARRG